MHPSQTTASLLTLLLVSIIGALFATTDAARAQSRSITGVVKDAQTGEPLQFASVRVDGSSKGTTTDRNGRFLLHVDRGGCTLVASYMGYASATRACDTPGGGEIAFALTRGEIHLPEVVVTPGDNPALEIIRQAIAHKERRRERLDNYSLTSHSKLAVTITGDAVKDRVKDSSVTAMMESRTDAWWAKPDHYKEVIKARKQSAFLEAHSNIMISAFFIVDFSQDVINLGGRMITGPISDAGLSEYSYTLTGMTTMDGTNVYMIDIAPFDEDDPLLKGKLYIADGSYAPVLVDVALTDAALPMMFKRMAFRQQFRLFDNEFWMPVDVAIQAHAEITMIVNIGIDVDGLSVLQDYAINKPVNADFFDKTVIKVLKEADERDSTWWRQAQLIPNSNEELEQYRKSDSVKTVLDAQRNDYGFGGVLTGKRFRTGNLGIDVPGILDMYRFDRVEGHALYGAFGIGTREGLRARLRPEVGYGFNDHRWKYAISGRVSHLPFGDMTIGAGVHDRVSWIDEGHDVWGWGGTTIGNLFEKYDYRDYFRIRGVNGYADLDVTSTISLRAFAGNNTYASLAKTTDWSITRQSWRYQDNPAINDGRITSFGAVLTYDSRDFIDNAGEIQRIGGLRLFDPEIGVSRHAADIGGEKWDFTIWHGAVTGGVQLGAVGTLTYGVNGDYAQGRLPTQSLLNLYGSPEVVASGDRFMTLNLREFGGDRRVVASIEHDFGEYLYRKLGLPFLKSSGWGLRLFGHGGLTTMSDATRAMQTVPTAATGHPFYEAGFGVTGILSFLTVDFAWRLNHYRDGRNFAIGISSTLIGGGGGGIRVTN